MSEMLEKVARAIADEGAYILPGESHADVDRRAALAAVRVMRDSTPEMHIAGHIALEAHLGVVHHRSTLVPAVWRAAIDSILSDAEGR